jgi:hypothetical protein
MTYFYTYLYLRDNGTPYYVGKGTRNRAFVGQGHRCKLPADKNFILIQEHPSEQAALEAEKFLIQYYGRIDLATGCLANLTDGGEEHGNPSAETRSKMSRAKLGRKQSPESIAKREETKRQRGLTVETRVKLGNATRKMWSTYRDRMLVLRKRESLSPETLAKMSASHRGSTHTPEVRSKLAEMARRCNLSSETLAKRSAALKGRKFSAETRTQMSVAAKARCARERQGGRTMGELLDKYAEFNSG